MLPPLVPPPLPLPSASLLSLSATSASSALGDAATSAAPRHEVAFNVIRSTRHHLVSMTVVKAGLCAFDHRLRLER